jgi:hypothetical protein
VSFIALNNTVIPNLNPVFEITIMIGHNAITAPDHTLVGFGASTNTKVTFPIYKASGLLNASGGYRYHRVYYGTSAPTSPPLPWSAALPPAQSVQPAPLPPAPNNKPVNPP